LHQYNYIPGIRQTQAFHQQPTALILGAILLRRMDGILDFDAAALRQRRPAGPAAETIPLARLMGRAQFRLM